MPNCCKCNHIFTGLGPSGSPYQNTLTGQWICKKCYNLLSSLSKKKYILI